MAAEGPRKSKQASLDQLRQWGRDRMAAEGICALAGAAPPPRVNGAATGWPRKGQEPRPRHGGLG